MNPVNYLPCFLAGVLSCNSILAADSQGLFMVKGGGRVECRQFLDAQQQKNNEFISLAGWLDGYLSYFNQSQPETFDIAPWQDAYLLLAAVGSWCKKNPEKTFHQAVFQMTATLHGKRLRDKSEFVTATHEGRSLVLYREILLRLQSQLKDRGFLQGAPSGAYDQQTIAGVKAFQKSKDLPVTGLPDQLTLANLL